MMIQNIFPATTQKVAANTKQSVNAKIRENTVNCLNTYKEAKPEVLTEKIKSCNNEWDIERVLETTSSSIITLASLCGFLKSKHCFFLITGTISTFLLIHAVKGWCPSLPFYRSMGVRTSEEINHEKVAFKILRGDFAQTTADMNQLFETVEKQ